MVDWWAAGATVRCMTSPSASSPVVGGETGLPWRPPDGCRRAEGHRPGPSILPVPADPLCADEHGCAGTVPVVILAIDQGTTRDDLPPVGSLRHETVRRVRRDWLDPGVASGFSRTVSTMTERQSSEVEKVLLHLSDARTRARRAAELVEKDGAEPHIVEALQDAERQLADLHRTLAQNTYYAVVDASLRLAV